MRLLSLGVGKGSKMRWRWELEQWEGKMPGFKWILPPYQRVPTEVETILGSLIVHTKQKVSAPSQLTRVAYDCKTHVVAFELVYALNFAVREYWQVDKENDQIDRIAIERLDTVKEVAEILNVFKNVQLHWEPEQ